MSNSNITRRVIFRPYRKGHGPTFALTLWDDCFPTFDSMGRLRLRYRLTQCSGDMTDSRRVTLFEGDDFALAPGHESDSDEAVQAVMNFLTLRPGDTDADYFANYTPAQLAFVEEHAETLAAEVDARFGEVAR